MERSNKSLRGILYLFLILCLAGTANAVTSLYVIPNQGASSVNAYEVDGYDLIYLDGFSSTGSGVDITLDPQLRILSQTGEFSGSIVLFDAIDVELLKTITVPNASNLAGIVADSDNQKLYVIDRYTNHLYILSWNGSTQTYDLDLPSPYYVELDGIVTGEPDGAYGIALDQTNDILYVADRSYDVKTYDTSDDWLHNPNDNITVSHFAIAVAVDVENQYVYTGSINGYGDGSYDLSQYDLNSSTESTVTVGSSVAGIAVDQSTNNVYLTTFNDGSYPTEVLIYSSSLTKVGPSSQLSLTKPTGLAIVDGTGVKPPNIDVTKDDGLEGACVKPYDEITYTIRIDSNGYDHEWVDVVDRLPAGVTFDSANPDTGYYTDPPVHTYTWEQLGPLEATDDDIVLTLTVTVNQVIEPAWKLTNRVTVESDIAYKKYTLDTCTECFGGNIIYVDSSVTDPNTGTSWELAYGDLQMALKRAERGCGDVIWVAGGIYSPGMKTTNSFKIPAGVVVYGGLAGNEDPAGFDPNTRDAIQYKTVLTGFIDLSNNNFRIVTMGQSTKLHGFVVKDSAARSVFGNNVDFTVERCVIKDSDERGIYCSGGNLTVNWCIVKNNTNDGIYSSGSGKRLRVYNCKIYDNGENGIYVFSGPTPFIKNSEIHHNGWDKRNNYDNGIRLESPSAGGVVRNCTIFRNEGYGIYFSGSNSPDIYNCIFYNNNYHDDTNYLIQFSSGLTAHYSSVTDPDDPNSTAPCTLDGNNNMSCDPNFAYLLINDHNLHLAADSPCINTGYPDGDYSDANDIDGDYRVYDDIVDMGSDEVSCTDEIANPLDWNGDGLVNNKEFAIFAKAWLTDTDDDAYNEKCDLNDPPDYHIDIDDFVIFAESWCWNACWLKLEGPWMMAMSRGLGMMPMEIEITPPELTIEEQIEQAESNIEFLEDVWENNEEVRETIDEEDWEGMIESIEAWIEELEEKL